ncbi:16S rRNA (cytidine(1402)-2'-O)-methyltransferase [Primorskyibacter sp. S187A]|uniref:16S rRNA (cytidine(1402)-2'-O)-methyltransferase n=1 Tax=Primorskyibacter sp. S187A TaxID=3415130 RepID=UPI003C7A3838
MSGRLTFVAVPIGNARDITLRAMDVLRDADVLAAEDTRALRRLMEIHGIALNGRRIQAYHEHNGDKARPALLEALARGQFVAYASEAGTPLISDPGFDLSRAAVEAGAQVDAAPGASAVLTALTVAGLPTDRFLFAGFLPSAAGARRAMLQELAQVPATLVFYESPHRIAASLAQMSEVLGPNRASALCRELTKKFEDVRRGSLEDLVQSVQAHPPKGEIVVVVDRAHSEVVDDLDIETTLRDALQRVSVRDAAEEVAGIFGLKKRDVYQLALKLMKD